MEISTTTWHYRFLMALECRRPRNLCSYFWMVVIHLMISALFAAGGLVVMTLLAAPIIAIWFPSWALAANMGYVMWLAILGVGWLMYRGWRETQLGYVKSPDGLAVAWIKAKKQRVCPLIEYTND